MGDRVRIQIVREDVDGPVKAVEISPVFYAHNGGSETPAILQRLRKRMGDRYYDVGYVFARLVQEFMQDDSGTISFGVGTTPSLDGRVRLLTEYDSFGDAGCVIIHLRGAGYWRCECVGGYLTSSEDGKDVTIQGNL